MSNIKLNRFVLKHGEHSVSEL